MPKSRSRKKKTRSRSRKPLFVLEHGVLGKYGYHANKTDPIRHRALRQAFGDSNPLAVARRLTALYVLHKNTHPGFAKIFRADSNWVKSTEEYKHRKN